VAAPAAAAPPRNELTLEPFKAEAAAASGPETPSRPEPAPSRASPGATAREQAQAATVLEAGRGPRRSAAAGIRASPLVLFGALAALIAIGFGTYVYLQLFHPSLFYRSPVGPKTPPSPLATAPAAGSVPPSVSAPGAVTPPPSDPAAPPQIAAAPLLQESATEGSVAPAPPAPPRAAPEPAPAAPPRAPAVRDSIKVSRGSAAPAVNPVLNDAYSALQSGQFERAQRGYERMLSSDARNSDALLGLAAIATLEGKTEDAVRRYMQVLEVEPRNALAQSSLIGLLGRADPLAAESRLKHLIAREPSAFLYFTLGNLYGDQSKWAAAQQAWFQAHQLEPRNPDYAYNLAVGLEHLSQGKLALGYYRRAVELAGGAAQPHFNLALAQERISKLASQVE
jgi:tetratricopeptide (TPR) repeat protein